MANLVKARRLEELTHLDLADCWVNDNGVARLAASPVFRNLISLDLSRNPLRDEGAYSLIKSSTLSSLRRLRLCAQELSKDAIDAFQDRFGAGLRLDP